MPRIVFVHPDGARQEIDADTGDSVLDIAHANGIDRLEGACEGCMACSTCHVIVDEAWFPRLPKSSEEEDDILDLAFGLTKTSRLGCQIRLTDDLDGLVVRIPSEHVNALEG
jgi:2Fe-2S ferredoxin